MGGWAKGSAALLLVVAMLPAELSGQQTVVRDSDWCDEAGSHGDLERVCEVREHTYRSPGGTIDVSAHPNGGITVEGWDRDEIRVRALVQAWAESEGEARTLLERVEVTDGGRDISSDGPRSDWDEEHWVVSFRVNVPRNTDLDLDTKNGGISIDGVSGRIRFETTNGGVSIDELAGDVKGRTTNGGISVRLNGDTWQGSGLDVVTTNGGVTMRIPEGYSARLETGTVNGGLRIDFPITVQGRIDDEISTDLGDGGPTIKARTTNGGVVIRRS